MSVTPIRTRFSENLRKLSLEKGKFSDVARDLGLNRQQFADYIGGKSLPNEQIVNNILTYFNIDISALFINNNAHNNTLPPHIFRRTDFLVENTIHAHMSGGSIIRSGIYYVYFKLNRNSEVILRSVMAIKAIRNVGTFRRISRYIGPDQDPHCSQRGINAGVVIISNGKLIFIGTDTINKYVLSILVGSGTKYSDVTTTGFAFVNAPYEYQMQPFAVTPAPRGISIRNALRNARLYYAESQEIPRSVKDYFSSI